MGNLVAIEHVTLDGVMQAPGGREEDTRGGFAHGGWAAAAGDDPDVGRAMGERMARSGSMLFGRRTYEQFHSYWPHQRDNPFTEVLDRIPKYVASTTLTEPLPWSNSTLLRGDLAEAVGALRERTADDVAILGSGELVRSLMSGDLVDEYVLLIHPLVLGTGRRLFPDAGPCANLRLVDSVTTGSGVIVATYQPGGTA